MAEVITLVHKKDKDINKIDQCDIFHDVEYIEYAIEKDEKIEISKIHFPNIIILTQACDLQQDFDAKSNKDKINYDKILISVIVAPIYNFEDFLNGEHLNQLKMEMQKFPKREKTQTKNIIENENKRYHYLKFERDVPLVESVIDFKHYFTITVNYLEQIYKTNYVCSVNTLYRELILQRFSNFLSRIGLPDN